MFNCFLTCSDNNQVLMVTNGYKIIIFLLTLIKIRCYITPHFSFFFYISFSLHLFRSCYFFSFAFLSCSFLPHYLPSSHPAHPPVALAPCLYIAAAKSSQAKPSPFVNILSHCFSPTQALLERYVTLRVIMPSQLSTLHGCKHSLSLSLFFQLLLTFPNSFPSPSFINPFLSS